MQSTRLTNFELKKYEDFEREFLHTYDAKQEDHEAVLRALHELCLDENAKQNSDERNRNPAWKDMGF